jgi:uncharacterized protein YkwD
MGRHFGRSAQVALTTAFSLCDSPYRIVRIQSIFINVIYTHNQKQYNRTMPWISLTWAGILALIFLFPGDVSAFKPGSQNQLISPGSPTVPTYSGCGGVPSPPVYNEQYELELVELVNQKRSDLGIPPLKRVDTLDKAARYHAIDMGQDSYTEHDSYDRVGDGLEFQCGFGSRLLTYYSYQFQYWIGENIAAGQTTPRSVMDAWMGSPGHRANILSRDFTEIGVGFYSGGPYGYYWVQDFGRHDFESPLIINDEDASTASVDVTIYIYSFRYYVGDGQFENVDWQQMRLRNDDGGWTNWQSFQNSFSWTLADSPGDRCVCVELTGQHGTESSCDTIFYINPALLTEKIYIPVIIR